MHFPAFGKMEVIPKFTIFVIVTCMLFTSTECEITTLNVVEGDVALLNFTYLCDSTEVTLQHGNGAPFYSSSNPNPSSLSSNLMLLNRNKTDGSACFLLFTINPVSRVEGGGYILFSYKDGQRLPKDRRILLFVALPPGKASCELSEGYIDDDWVRLHCTAPLGDVKGHIVCYQNGMKIPPLTSPVENDNTLSQTVLAKLGDHVYCCSSSLDQTKDRCDCKDSVWDPMQNKQVTSFSDPCPATLPIEYPTFSKQPSEDTAFESTSAKIKTLPITSTSLQINSNKAVYGLIVVVCVLIVAFVISVAGTVYYFKKHPKKPGNLKLENGGIEPFISPLPLEKV